MTRPRQRLTQLKEKSPHSRSGDDATHCRVTRSGIRVARADSSGPAGRKRLRYARRVSRLLACPFCRELFSQGETDGVCPECGVKLEPMEKLPPSPEAMAEAMELVGSVPPEDQRLPWSYWGRGRGALLLLALAGLGAFFAPWVDMTLPDEVSISGFDLARGRAGWLWGGAVAWFVSLPLVWTRRTVMQMRGVRVIVTLFAAMTLGETLMLVSRPPGGNSLVPVALSWGWGLYASAAISLAGMYFGARFGGRLDTTQPAQSPADSSDTGSETSAGKTLH